MIKRNRDTEREGQRIKKRKERAKENARNKNAVDPSCRYYGCRDLHNSLVCETRRDISSCAHLRTFGTSRPEMPFPSRPRSPRSLHDD